MLYIHKLSQLTPKTAEVESVYLIREIKQKTSYPLKEAHVQDYLIDFTISDTDREAMIQGAPLVATTIEALKRILTERDPLYEVVNIQRAIQVLSDVPEALHKNISFAEDIAAWQMTTFVPELIPLFNSIPRLRTQQEKAEADKQLSFLFQRILRNKDFGFHFLDIVNEGHVSNVAGLSDSMVKGFLFHFTLEEELKKQDFNWIRRRIPAEKLGEVELIERNVAAIRKSVERAYEVNMRMVNLGLVLYSYVKWLMNESFR